MTSCQAKPENVRVHESGKRELPSGRVISVLPLIDISHSFPFGLGSKPLFARLDYEDSLIVAEREGAKLISPEGVIELGNVGLQLYPYLGTPIAETEISHAIKHDRNVWQQLLDRKWDGQQSVAGAGKHWVDGAPAGKSRLMGWDKDGPGPSKTLWQELAVAHNRKHFDDGTTTMLEWQTGDRPAVLNNPPFPTNQGDRGPLVGIWQRWLNAHEDTLPPLKIDNAHGPLTTAKADAYWIAHGLEEVHSKIIIESKPGLILPPIIFKRAKTYQPGRVQPILGICIHTAECTEHHLAAENLQAWDAGANAPKASWHYAVDNDSITQSVREEDRAWAANSGPAHETGVHIELAGRANQTPTQWADTFSTDMLDLAAMLCADICKRRETRVAKIGATELRAGVLDAFYGHVDVTDAWHRTTHRDPGVNFPWDSFLAEVGRKLAA